MLKKRAQITIFVIIGIIILVSIVFYMILRGDTIINFRPAKLPEPQAYLTECFEESVIQKMLAQGGYLEPENYKLFEGNKIAYLCYNMNYYYPCVNQEPMYFKHLENEITDNSEDKINSCFEAFKEEYEKKGFDIVLEDRGAMQVNCELSSRKLEVDIDRTIEISGKGEEKKYDEFKLVIATPLYDLASIAVEIVDQEAKYCHFEYIGYSLLYPEVYVERYTHGGNENAAKIYVVEDKYTKDRLKFAVRGCIIPAGF
ncbi:MAG: hypothetical protein ABIH72_03670 [archaeon]